MEKTRVFYACFLFLVHIHYHSCIKKLGLVVKEEQ